MCCNQSSSIVLFRLNDSVMRKFGIILICLVWMSCEKKEDTPAPPNELLPPATIRAVDLSFLPEIRQRNIPFKNQQGIQRDALDIFKEAGSNYVRLRLWHTPGSAHSSLNEVQAFASEIKNKGLKLWITIHYSDTWADPGAQTKPSAWQSLGFTALSDSIFNYSRKVASLLQPDIVQAGNEINDGLLWPDGRLSVNRANFIHLLKRAISGLRTGHPGSQIMIHYANPQNSNWFFNILKEENVEYDLIGISYYARWHTRNLNIVQTSLTSLANEFNKPIVLAETAYPFTLGWADWTNNLVGLNEHLIDGYGATQQGQYQYLVRIRQILNNVPQGIGFCYWAPDWVAFKGAEATDGSSWENMALFDFSFRATQGMRALAAE